MKKYFIYLVVLLFGIITITVWWFLSDNSSRPGFDAINSIKERSGPVFQEEGILYFIHPDLSDTIKSIKIEVADNPEKISRGLMYRNSLDDNQGMLFIFDAEQEKTFWMKNTRFSLDIIFINSEHYIVNIAKHTIPYSRDPIPSMKPARYVLEVNGGFCDAHKIEVRSIVQFVLNNSLSL